MSKNWAIAVWNQAFDTRRAVYSWTTSSITLDGDGAVTPSLANIQELEWSVTRNENSLDATWKGDSNGSILSIQPQDRIIIYTLGHKSGETVTTYYPRFRGYASIPANTNHVDGLEHQYRALGISRLCETIDTGENHQIAEGNDLASGVANTIINNLPDSLPGGITYSTFSDIGVTNTGKINPGSADLAQNMDALVTLCETTSVSAAWGVKPDGSLFFEEVNTDTITIDEGAAGTLVEWSEPQADEIISAVRWIIADGNSKWGALGGASEVPLDTPDVLTHLSDSGISTYGRRVVTLTPPAETNVFTTLDWGLTLDEGTLHASWVGDTQDGTADFDRVEDGNPISYGVFTPDAQGDVVLNATVVFPSNTVPSIALVTTTFKADPDSDSPDSAYAYILTGNGVGDEAYHALWGSVKPHDGTTTSSEGLNEVNYTLVYGDRAINAIPSSASATVKLKVNVQAASGTPRVAVSDMRLWEVNTDLLDALAEQEYRFPEEDAFEATINGELAPSGLADIIKLDDTTITDLEVTSIGYRITGDRGTETLITVGPRTPAHVTEEQARIKRRDRLASLSGSRAGSKTLSPFGA